MAAEGWVTMTVRISAVSGSKVTESRSTFSGHIVDWHSIFVCRCDVSFRRYVVSTVNCVSREKSGPKDLLLHRRPAVAETISRRLVIVPTNGGMARLGWPGWFKCSGRYTCKTITCLSSTNRARRRVTSLMCATPLPCTMPHHLIGLLVFIFHD